MLETSCKEGLQPEGAHYHHSETVINYILKKRRQQQQHSFGINVYLQNLQYCGFLSFIFLKFYWLC